MDGERELLQDIKKLIQAKRYRVRIHAVRHMIEEGFGEENLIKAVTGKSRLLENYLDEQRCLVSGYFLMEGDIRTPRHVVCDYSKGELVDIVTAYFLQKPWWLTPTKRGRTV